MSSTTTIPTIATAMLQDAVWVNADWIAEEGNEDIATRFLTASFQGWLHCLDNFDECVEVVLNNGSTLGQSHQEWQLNEILGLIFPATNGIGIMNTELWDQTVAVATEQIPELQGVSIPADVYRTDLAEAAVENLGDVDVTGAGLRAGARDRAPGGRQLETTRRVPPLGGGTRSHIRRARSRASARIARLSP